MGKRLIFLYLIFALLLGSVVAPATAHTGSSSHSTELLDLDCIEATQGADDKSDPAPGTPQHADHHHCSTGLILGGGGSFVSFDTAAGPVHPAPVRSLSSRALAPLTEPPSA